MKALLFIALLITLVMCPPAMLVLCVFRLIGAFRRRR